VAKGWTEEQRRAYVIADNRLAESSTWDSANLIDELAALTHSTFDMALMGFSSNQLAKLMGATNAADMVPPGEAQPLAQRVTATCPQCGHAFDVQQLKT